MDVDAIAGELRSSGFVAIEHSLSPAVRARIDDGCRESTAFAPAAVGSGGQRTHDAGIRGDIIRWLDDTKAADRSAAADRRWKRGLTR